MAVLLALAAASVLQAQFNKRYFYYIGNGLINDGKYAEAIEMLNGLLAADTLSADGFFLRGIAKYNLNDIVGAESDFSHAIRVNPTFTQAYHYRAITRSFMGDYEASVADFDKALDIRPDLEGIYYSRGVTHFLNMQFDKAIADFDYFIRRSPYVVDAYINRGTSYLMLKDTTRAFEDYNKAVEINHYDPSGFLRRGGVYLMREQYDKAFDDLTEAIRLDSVNLPAYFNRALVYSATDRPLEAIKDLNKVLELDSTSSISYFNRAVIYSQIGDYNHALADYRKVSEYSPNNVLAHFNRGGVNMKLGFLEDAEADFSRAIELYPDFANAYLARSNVRYALQNMTGSKADYDTAQRKIAEYRTKITDSTFSVYADTSQVFNKLLSFDVDFGNEEFENVKADDFAVERSDFIPMFRFAVLSPAQSEKEVKPRYRYDNAALTDFLNRVKDTQTSFSFKPVEVSENVLRSLDEEREAEMRERETFRWEDAYARGVYLYSQKQYTGAINQLSQAIAQDPDNGMLYLMRAVVNTEMTDFIASIGNGMQRLVIEASPSEQLKNTKRVYNYDAALSDAARAVDLMPDMAYAYYNRAAIRYRAGDLPGAIADYTKALELFPYFGEAYYNRGLVLLHLKDTRKGVIDIGKAGELGVEKAYPLLKKIRHWDELE